MLRYCWKMSRLRAALMSGAAALAFAACGADSAASQEGNEDFITRMERQILGGAARALGLRGQDDAVIYYRERSPLVVPPSRDLPPPQSAAAPKSPNWPVDPDRKRAKERADAKKKRTTGNFDSSVDNPGAISPDELNRGRSASTTTTTATANTMGSRDGRTLTPSELGTSGIFNWRAFGFGSNNDEVGTFTSEPPRGSLTAPPPGYQTPSPAFPYGTTRRKEDAVQGREYDPAVGQY
jgi:hypothetical protein